MFTEETNKGLERASKDSDDTYSTDPYDGSDASERKFGNELTPDNYDTFWTRMKPLFKSNAKVSTKRFPFSMLMFDQRSYFLRPTIFEFPKPVII